MSQTSLPGHPGSYHSCHPYQSFTTVVFLTYSHFFRHAKSVAIELLTQHHIPEDFVISSIAVGTSNLTTEKMLLQYAMWYTTALYQVRQLNHM
jgi:hypothetical protein